MSIAHRVELPDDRQLGVIVAAARGRRADEVTQLDLGQADPAVDRRGHPAIAQVDLGIEDRRLRPLDVGLGGEDVRLVVGLGLLQARLVGLDLGRVLLAERLLALDVLDRGGVPLEQRLFAPLLDLGELERRLGDRAWAVATSRALESRAFFRLASAASSLALASASLALKGSSSMTNRSWPALTSPPSVEVHLLEEPAHPGTDRDLLEGPRRPDRLGHDRDGHPPRSTTETIGGGGTRSASARGEQPEVVNDARRLPARANPAFLARSA